MVKVTQVDQLFVARLFGFASWEQFEQGCDMAAWDRSTGLCRDAAAHRLAAYAADKVTPEVVKVMMRVRAEMEENGSYFERDISKAALLAAFAKLGGA